MLEFSGSSYFLLTVQKANKVLANLPQHHPNI